MPTESMERTRNETSTPSSTGRLIGQEELSGSTVQSKLFYRNDDWRMNADRAQSFARELRNLDRQCSVEPVQIHTGNRSYSGFIVEYSGESVSF